MDSIAQSPFEHRGVVQFSLTNQCQCNCAHCGVKDLNRPPFGRRLSTGQILAIIQNIKISGFRIIDMYGGEPTMRPDLPEIVAYGRSLGLDMVLETNALKLDRRYLKRLKEAGVGRIYISLDDFSGHYHDENRGRKTFDHAVGVMNLCREEGMETHTSIVPRDREYFLDGRFNRYVRFCLENGATGIRILFPCMVGNCLSKKNMFASEKDEKTLFNKIDPQYRDLVYVSSEMATIRMILEGKALRCAAKSVFCHITSSGRLMPCPYLPLLYGDVTKESLSDVFERVQEHPLLRKGGLYCPSRDPRYIKKYLEGLDRNHPYVEAKSENRIDLGSGCNNNCVDCGWKSSGKSSSKVMGEIRRVDKDYRAVHLYGGEPLLRRDIFKIFEAAGERHEIHLYTNAGVFSDPALARRLGGLPVKSVRVPFFSSNERSFDAHTRAAGSFREAMRGVANLCRCGVPVQIYLAKSAGSGAVAYFRSVGVKSISVYEKDESAEPLPETVLCFGRGLSRTSLLWRKS